MAVAPIKEREMRLRAGIEIVFTLFGIVAALVAFFHRASWTGSLSVDQAIIVVNALLAAVVTGAGVFLAWRILDFMIERLLRRRR